MDTKLSNFSFLWKVLYSIIIFISPILGASIYSIDDAHTITLNTRHPNSHLHVYIPSLPYGYIMRLINGTLVRLDESAKGWDYYIAYKHEKLDSLTYDFWLRDDVKFQDGTPLDADIVVYNFTKFIQGAFTFTDIHHKLKSVEKIDKYHIRIHLNEPYGLLMSDLTRINLYTKKYYEKYSWSNSIIGENTLGTGTYGAGPYILVQGHATGLSQSDTVVLKANPYYFEKGKPYIQTLTIHTRMPIHDVINGLANNEGKIDIAFIPLNKKTEIVNSTYAKLSVIPSTTTLNFQMNLMNPSSPLHNKKIRQALNQALNQENLIKFAYKGEGIISPFAISSNVTSAKAISQEMTSYPPSKMSQEELKYTLQGLTLNIVTQDRFLDICRGVEYQLNQYGVHFTYDLTSDEKYVFQKLLTNRISPHSWDLLLWGNVDWAKHPWSALFTLYTPNQWCAIKNDEVLDEYMRKLFTLDKDDEHFTPLIETILRHINEEAYTLNLPSPNTLLGMNKEVDATPSSVAILKLWEAKITANHWSVRGENRLPSERLQYRIPTRINFHE